MHLYSLSISTKYTITYGSTETYAHVKTQVRNQEFFRAREFSGNYGTLISNHVHTTQER